MAGWQRPSRMISLTLEQPRPLLGREERAMLDLAEPAVAIARHQCIRCIAPPFGHDGGSPQVMPCAPEHGAQPQCCITKAR